MDTGMDTVGEEDPSWDPGFDSVPDTGSDAPIDTGVDTAFDTGVDTAFDTGVDTAFDTGVDTAFDTGVDTAFDSGPDTAIDTWVDAGLDTGVDTAMDTPSDPGFDLPAPDRILLLIDRCWSVDHITPAISRLGLTAATVSTTGVAAFRTQLAAGPWDIIIVDSYGGYLVSGDADLLVDHLDAGGRLILFRFDLYEEFASHEILTRAGVSLSGDFSTPEPVYSWEAGPLFSTPNVVPDLVMMDDPCIADGQYAEPTTGYAQAGFTPTYQAYRTAITISADGRFILNTFSPSIVDQDIDGDGVDDMVELYENEIRYLY